MVENLKPKGLASLMRSVGLLKDYGITDRQLRTTNARKRTSAMNDDLLYTIRSLALSTSRSCLHSSNLSSSSAADSVYKTFVQSLLRSNQEYAADLAERGGGKCNGFRNAQSIVILVMELKHVQSLNPIFSSVRRSPTMRPQQDFSRSFCSCCCPPLLSCSFLVPLGLLSH